MLNSKNRLLFLSLFLFLISGSSVHGRTFKRPDPLQHFKNYNGDFDVRNKHYLAVSRFSIINNVCVWIWSSSHHITSHHMWGNIWDWEIEIGFWSFSVCGIYRSSWIRICRSLVVVWSGFGHFHDGEVFMQWLSLIIMLGPLPSTHFLSCSLPNLSCHVSPHFSTPHFAMHHSMLLRSTPTI